MTLDAMRTILFGVALLVLGIGLGIGSTKVEGFPLAAAALSVLAAIVVTFRGKRSDDL